MREGGRGREGGREGREGGKEERGRGGERRGEGGREKGRKETNTSLVYINTAYLLLVYKFTKTK